MGALHNSLERQELDAPKCHPDTRIAVISRLIQWITGEIDFDALILWLYGAAGAGKSAIAHSIADICMERGWLLATFFFWKSATERSNVARFVATIAYQMARAIPALRLLIKAAIDADPMIFRQSIDTQLAKLVLGPLHQLHSTGFNFINCPFVTVIDGLNECRGNEIQCSIVRSLASAFKDSPVRFRILIASRPEVYLQSTFNSSLVQPHLARLALSHEFSPEKDIYRFLKDSFEKIKREHPLASYISSSWPSADVLEEITNKSSGQFIFASTTVKYVGGDPHQLPHRRLDVILQIQSPRGENDVPYAELDSLYHHVLSNVTEFGRVKQVLGVIFIVNPVIGFRRLSSVEMIDDFIFWQPGETKACLSQLASLIECDAAGDIHILHVSLLEFLLDPARSHEFHLCRGSILGDIAALGLHHMHQQAIFNKGGLLLASEIFQLLSCNLLYGQITFTLRASLLAVLMLSRSAQLHSRKN